MSTKDVFEKLRRALDAAGISYFVTGSFVSSAHGVPRSTNDIDIVIAPSAAQLDLLLDQFPRSDFGADREDAHDAIRRAGSFNVVEYQHMWKIDFMVSDLSPFDRSRFARREIIEIAGARVYAASPEDILITKLWWAKLGESERQINDAVGIVQVQGSNLDVQYVERWVAELQLDQQWQKALARVG